MATEIRALALFSGGLDSTLAIRILRDQGIAVHALRFHTGFCLTDDRKKPHVNPGEIYRLSFPVEGKQVQILARAVRVFASHWVTVEGGERQIVYRTGTEFVGVEKGTADLISIYLDRMPKEGDSGSKS